MIISMNVSNFVKKKSGINDFTVTYLLIYRGVANFGARCSLDVFYVNMILTG